MQWAPFMGYVYMLANMVVAACYFAICRILQIPAALHPSELAVLSVREQMRARRVYGAFFLGCGGMHVAENVLSFWWAPYHLFTVGHVATAMASVCGVYYTVQHRARIMVGI